MFTMKEKLYPLIYFLSYLCMYSSICILSTYWIWIVILVPITSWGYIYLAYKQKKSNLPKEKYIYFYILLEFCAVIFFRFFYVKKLGDWRIICFPSMRNIGIIFAEFLIVFSLISSVIFIIVGKIVVRYRRRKL